MVEGSIYGKKYIVNLSLGENEPKDLSKYVRSDARLHKRDLLTRT